MSDMNKKITHISWLFSACLEQSRYIMNDSKQAMNLPRFFNSVLFTKYFKHMNMSVNLLKQSEKTWVNLFKTGRMNTNTLNNLQVVYVKRSVFQQRLAAEYLSQIVYDIELNTDLLYKGIYSKFYNFGNLLGQLDQQIRILRDMSA